MTQRILSIDISDRNARAAIVEIDGKDFRIIESRQAFIGDLFFIPENTPAALNGNSESQRDDQEGSSDSKSEEGGGGPADYMSRTVQYRRELESFINLLSELEGRWTESIVVIPSLNYLSLNLNLPFKDQKNISKVLELEVQDLLPFDISEFHVQHQNVGVIAGNEQDIHVSLLPKEYLRFILKTCSRANVEPLVVTTRTSALSAFFYLFPEEFKDNSLLVYRDSECIYMTSLLQGNVRTDRVIKLGSNGKHAGQDGESSGFAGELTLSVAAFENRYQENIESIFLIDGGGGYTPGSTSLNGRLKVFDTSNILPPDHRDFLIPLIASVFVRESQPPELLTNFRVKEFSYRPQLKELTRGIKRALPFMMLFVALFIIALPLTYYSRQFRMERIENEIFRQVSRAVPGLTVTPGQEIAALQAENNRLETALRELGSRAETTPLHIFSELVKTLPETREISYNSILIGSRVRIEGSARDYAAVDAIERSLRRNKSVFCRVTRRTSTQPAGRDGITFDLDIRICE